MNKNRMHIETDKESLSNKYRVSQGKSERNINRMKNQMYKIAFLSLKIPKTTFQKISPNQRQSSREHIHTYTRWLLSTAVNKQKPKLVK